MAELTVHRGAHGSATLVLDRPQRSNAITPALADALHDALAGLAADSSVRVVLLRGAGGRAFCGGYDLEGVTSGVRDYELQRMLGLLRALPVPTVAVVDGHAVGAGFDLACSCDLRVVRRGSKIGLPAVRIGVAYDAAALRRIVARMPLARRVLLTGELTLAENLDGFADVLADPGDVDRAVDELVEQFEATSPASVEYMVAMLRPHADPDPAAARVWRDRILDGPDAAAAAVARAEGSTPTFAPRHTEGWR